MKFESVGGQSSKKLNRREFLKATPVVAGAVGMMAEREVEAQTTEGEKMSASEITELFISTQQEKIHFPDVFQPATQEAADLILSIVDYLSSTEKASASDSKSLAQKIDGLNRSLFLEFKKINQNLGNYSDRSFFRFLAYEVPKFLASFGIYAEPAIAHEMKRNQGIPQSTNIARLGLLFYKINKVKRDTVEIDGVKIPRNILFVEGLVVVNGKPTAVIPESQHEAQTLFQNIIIFEYKIQSVLDIKIKGLKEFQSLDTASGGRLVSSEEAALLTDNNPRLRAAEIAMAKISLRKMDLPTYQQEEGGLLVHETAHLVSKAMNELKKIWIENPSDPANFVNNLDNFNVHNEITPLTVELRDAPNRALNLRLFLNEGGRNPSDGSPIYNKAKEWILRNMVDFISKDPQKYGMKFSADINVSIANQILSQLDVLLDKPELFTELCSRLIELHKGHMADDLMGGIPLAQEQDTFRKPEDSVFSKIGKPFGWTLGAATLLEGARRLEKKLRQRKISNMSRQQKKRLKK